jgi:hypothetical protein
MKELEYALMYLVQQQDGMKKAQIVGMRHLIAYTIV